MKAILITRPAEDAKETGDQIRRRGFEPLFAPALNIEFNTIYPDSLPPGALIISSANAIRALEVIHPPASFFSRTVFAVGDHTADAARKAGFQNVRSAAGTMQNLVRLIRQGVPGLLIHLRGADIREDPAEFLTADEGWHIESRIAYKAVPVSHIADDIIERLKAGSIAATLFYSARSGQFFAQALQSQWPDADCSGTKALCLSSQVVESINTIQWSEICVSETPDQAGMLALMDTLNHDAE